MKKLVIIPAYNEQDNILTTIQDIREHAPGFDYIIINDSSTDRTLQICREHQLCTLELPVNMGIGGAVQTGYLYALERGYDCVVQFDGDGQHDAKYLNEMAEHMEKTGADMVIGSRFITNAGFQSSYMRRVGIRYFTFLIKLLTGKKITDPTSGMRMANRRVVRLYSYDYPRDYPEPESVVAILKNKMKVEELPVVMRERTGGVTSISADRSVYYMFKVTLAILVECLRRRS